MLLYSGSVIEESDSNSIEETENSPVSEDMPVPDDVSNKAVAGTPRRSISMDDEEQTPANSVVDLSNTQEEEQAQHVASTAQGQHSMITRNRQLLSQHGPSSSSNGEASTTQAQVSGPHPRHSSSRNLRPLLPSPSNHSATLPLPRAPQRPILQTSGSSEPPDWVTAPQAWSPLAPTPLATRKRSLAEANPSHDMNGYPLERNYKDKIEEELDELELDGDKAGRGRKRQKKARRPATRHAHEKDERDGRDGKGKRYDGRDDGQGEREGLLVNGF